MSLLDGIAAIDWTHWVSSVVGDLAHGGGYTFLFPPCHMTPRDIELMLRRNGFTTWGLLHVDGTTMLSVRKGDAQRAYSLLQQHGIPVENPPPPQPKRPRKAQGRREGGVFSVFDIFD